MHMFDAIRHHCDHYYQQLPDHIPDAALISAVCSFALSAIFSGSVEVGTRTGILAATVTIISGLTMPIFRYHFADQDGRLSRPFFAVTQIANLAMTQFLVNSTTTYRVNLMSSIFFTVIFSGLLMNSNDVDTRDAQPYILV